MTVATFSLLSAAVWTTLAALALDGPIAAVPTVRSAATIAVLALWNTAGAAF